LRKKETFVVHQTHVKFVLPTTPRGKFIENSRHEKLVVKKNQEERKKERKKE
jgi:hypothetical protein